ncbi:MAG: 16S rRNA (guanine(527)-N(7))-methyltransferase RsmG [Bacilli bacterium]|nr:16S rRNA (guanine(527)-N(7))-methyltransferase RsmG [Bacilli bacterium]
MNINEFIEELNKIGITLTDKQLDELNTYKEFLKEYNSHTNLTAITEDNEIYLKHFYDSLTLAKYVNLSNVNKMLDIGTGAGFPGMVIKIVFPNIDMYLMDSNNKKLDFLTQLSEKLGLTNVHMLHIRAEEYAKSNRESFDLVTSRAVAALPILTELALPLTKVDGKFVALKANAQDEIRLSKDIINKLNGNIDFIEEFTLPKLEDPRTIIVMSKKGHTSDLYPREYGKIKKEYDRLKK